MWLSPLCRWALLPRPKSLLVSVQTSKFCILKYFLQILSVRLRASAKGFCQIELDRKFDGTKLKVIFIGALFSTNCQFDAVHISFEPVTSERMTSKSQTFGSCCLLQFSRHFIAQLTKFFNQLFPLFLFLCVSIEKNSSLQITFLLIFLLFRFS